MQGFLSSISNCNPLIYTIHNECNDVDSNNVVYKQFYVEHILKIMVLRKQESAYHHSASAADGTEVEVFHRVRPTQSL